MMSILTKDLKEVSPKSCVINPLVDVVNQVSLSLNAIWQISDHCKSMAGIDLDNCTLSWKAETIRSKGCLGSGQALHIEMNIKINMYIYELCQSQNLALSF